jgi:hypothetical protein
MLSTADSCRHRSAEVMKRAGGEAIGTTPGKSNTRYPDPFRISSRRERTRLETPIQGRVLGFRRIELELGSGGIGPAWVARDEKGHRFAIHVIHAYLLALEAVAGLVHPGRPAGTGLPSACNLMLSTAAWCRPRQTRVVNRSERNGIGTGAGQLRCSSRCPSRFSDRRARMRPGSRERA